MMRRNGSAWTPTWTQALLWGAIALASSACGEWRVRQGTRPPAESAAVPTTEIAPPETGPTEARGTAAAKVVPQRANGAAAALDEAAVGRLYERALTRAYSAAKLTQSATFPADWAFVVERWQAAIDLLETVPEGSTQRAGALEKIAEYRRSQAYAREQAARAEPPSPEAPLARRAAPPEPEAAPRAPLPGELVAQIPIRNRLGGIPVVEVVFDGQPFPMLLDTGASSTVITAAMAEALGVDPEGTIRANTPSDRAASFSVGRVKAANLGDLEARDLTVAISPQMEIGLLGQNFFGNYDLTIRRDRVEFHAR